MFVCIMISGLIFFLKQKTAYEMRISDWSSDVCSSDLRFLIVLSYCARRSGRVRKFVYRRWGNAGPGCRDSHTPGNADTGREKNHSGVSTGYYARWRRLYNERSLSWRDTSSRYRYRDADILPRRTRSEEHTSELQSIMRISYAVFCLKKK